MASLLGCLLASACEQPAQQRPDAPIIDGQARDTATPDPAARDTAAPALTPGGAVTVPRAEAHHFDAATLAVGDTFLGLRVVRSDVRRVFEDSVWIGNVAFSGPIEVAGVFQPHFDYPEVDRLCFHVVDPMMVRRIPEFAPDTWTSPNGKTWFCFTNADDARRLLGTGEPPHHATIVIDDYQQVREFTDAWDTARLVRVVTVGGPASRTLRQ